MDNVAGIKTKRKGRKEKTASTRRETLQPFA